MNGESLADGIVRFEFGREAGIDVIETNAIVAFELTRNGEVSAVEIVVNMLWAL